MKNKFIFSFKSIVIFVFCFVLLGSLILSLSLSKKASGLDVSEPVGGWESLEEPSPSDTGGNGGINTGGITITDTGGAGMMGDNPAEDIAVMPVGAQVGDTWTGPSGQTYIATFSNPELVSELAAQGIIVTPYWAPVDSSSNNTTPPNDSDNDKYSCSGAPNYTCYTDSNGAYSSLAACQSSCKPSTITPTVDPSQAQYRCMQCRCH